MPLQAGQASAWDEIVTVEDHLQDGGLGSWMPESLVTQPALRDRLRIKVLSQEVCGMVDKQELLNELGGLVDR